MSFRCFICGDPQEDGVKPVRVALVQRNKVYLDEDLNVVGRGKETVIEANLCTECAEAVQS